MDVTSVPLALLTAHFVGDFLLQSDWMATNKSKRWDALALHVTAYTSAFFLWGLHWQFIALVWLTHFVTDAITSRITSALWFFKREDGIWVQAEYAQPKHGRTLVNPWSPIDGNRHWFFLCIGADQLLHFTTLAILWKAFVR